MTVELHYKLHPKIDASNLYYKIALVWLDSSLSVGEQNGGFNQSVEQVAHETYKDT